MNKTESDIQGMATMFKQDILKSIVDNNLSAFETALRNVETLSDLTYETDEAPLTLQVLHRAFHLSLIDLGDRVVQTVDTYNVTNISARKAAVYINLLLKKGISESEARDFVITYYGVVASDNSVTAKIDPTYLAFLRGQFDLTEPVTIALAIYLDEYAKAMTKKHWSHMEILISHGAEPNRLVRYSKFDSASPMEIAGKSGNIRIAKYFIENGADAHDLIVGKQRIKTLHDEGIKPNIWPTAVAQDGQTDASRFIGSLGASVPYETVMYEFKYLLESGVKWNVASRNGELPLGRLMLASIYGRLPEATVVQLCKSMIDNGADLNASNYTDDAETPLMVALSTFEFTERDDREYRAAEHLINILLYLGASVSKKNGHGLTALHYAAKLNPGLVPLLRTHTNWMPTDIADILLFSGAEKCLRIIESSSDIDETSLQHTFYYAVKLQHLDLVNHILLRRFDVVAALEQSRNEIQDKSTIRTYTIELLEFMARVSNQNLMPFWRGILMIDTRLRARRIAQAWLAATLGEAAMQDIMTECVERLAQEQKLIRRQTREFVAKIRALFSLLRKHKVFAVDIDGYSWPPSDGGCEVVYDMISQNDLDEFGVANGSDMPICWTNTGYYKLESKSFNTKARMQSAVTKAHIYYAAHTKRKRIEIASRIAEVAVASGFQVDWNGDAGEAVTLSCNSVLIDQG